MLKRYLLLTAGLLLTPLLMAQTSFDFEGSGAGSTEGWEYTCGAPTLENEGSQPNNQWSLNVEGGNTQGCVPSYVYTTLEHVESIKTITAIARSLDGPAILSLGKLTADNEVIIIRSDTTFATSWTELNVDGVDTLDLDTGEAALIVLSSGLVAGPVAEQHALFDFVYITALLNTKKIEKKFSFNLSPNPAQEQIKVRLPRGLSNPAVTVYNLLGMPICCETAVMKADVLSVMVNDLPEGSYILQLTDDRQRKAARKFIVAR